MTAEVMLYAKHAGVPFTAALTIYVTWMDQQDAILSFFFVL